MAALVPSVNIYDNTSAASKKAVVGKCVGANLQSHFIFENPVVVENGIYVEISGIGTTAIVYYGG